MTISATFGPVTRASLGLGKSLHRLVRRGELGLTYPWAGKWITRYPDGLRVVATDYHGLGWRDNRRSYLDIVGTLRPQRGWRVLELGAGIGTESLLLAEDVGPTGLVLAVEPHPRVFECLQLNASLNGLRQLRPIAAAITAERGEVIIEDGESTDGISNRVLPAAMATAGNGHRVTGITLNDALMKMNVPSVDLVKVNIEGGERDVIAALADAKVAVRTLVVSCHDFKAAQFGDSMRTWDFVRRQLVDLGYAVTDRRNDPLPYLSYYLYATKTP